MDSLAGSKRKIVSLVLFAGLTIGGLGLLVYSGLIAVPEVLRPVSPEQKLMKRIQGDLDLLKQEKLLHEGFNSIKDVQLFTSSPKLKQVYFKFPLSLNQKSDGKFNLEVFMDEIEEGGVLVQYDLIDLDSGNTVFEIGRTFEQSN